MREVPNYIEAEMMMMMMKNLVDFLLGCFPLRHLGSVV
jgi:hypothetical protein